MSFCSSCETLPAKFIEEFSSLKFCGKKCQTQYHSVGLKTYTYDYKTKGPILLKDNPNVIGLLSTDNEIFEITKEQAEKCETLKLMGTSDTDAPVPVPADANTVRLLLGLLTYDMFSESDIVEIVDFFKLFHLVHYLGYTEWIRYFIEDDFYVISKLSQLRKKDYDYFYNLFMKNYILEIISLKGIAIEYLGNAAKKQNTSLVRLFFEQRSFILNDDTDVNLLYSLIPLDNFAIFLDFINFLPNTPIGFGFLKFAARNNYVESLEVLIGRNLDTAPDKYYVIRKMIQFGNLKMVKLLLPSSLATGRLLKTAVKYNQLVIFDFLMEHIGDFVGMNYLQTTQKAIASAIIYNRVDMFHRVIAQKVMLTSSIFEKCAIYGRLEMLKELLIIGVRFKKFEKLFITAALYGHVDIVEFLIKTYPDRNYDRELAIRRANENEHPEIENYLSTTMESSVKKSKINGRV